MRSLCLALAVFALSPARSQATEAPFDDRLAAAALAYLAEERCPGGINLDYTAFPPFGDQAQRYLVPALRQYNEMKDIDLGGFCAAAIREGAAYGLIGRSPDQDPEAYKFGSMMALLFVCPDFGLDPAKLDAAIGQREAAEKGFKDRVNNFAVSVGARIVNWKTTRPTLLRETCERMEALASSEGLAR